MSSRQGSELRAGALSPKRAERSSWIVIVSASSCYSLRRHPLMQSSLVGNFDGRMVIICETSPAQERLECLPVEVLTHYKFATSAVRPFQFDVRIRLVPDVLVSEHRIN